MQRLCVFCGSSPGLRPEYLEASRDLARVLAAQRIELVYGGSRVGLMGALAQAMLEHGGQVTGVIPEALVEKELAFTDATRLHVVGSMHERKALMADLSDGFIALPGGFGTLDEFFEAVTWVQLGIHRKPCGLLNVCGYFDSLAVFLDHATERGFIQRAHRAIVLMAGNGEELVSKLRTFLPPAVDKAAWALEQNGPLRA
ncbi:MAG: TIGR00730 family Rossman fold protein [Thermoanaerobaculia bacterium]|nr:TIGR00730 family Rossman fold protein [Thermoanaerobaculia bacterium]